MSKFLSETIAWAPGSRSANGCKLALNASLLRGDGSKSAAQEFQPITVLLLAAVRRQRLTEV